jgi:hypothetical protein
MSRSRNIKPGFFKNDLLAECEPLARLLFAGLWCEADREGRLEDRPKRLKAECLGYDDCDIEALLNQLSGKGFIVRYVVEGIGYIAIPEFLKHQKPHMKEAASTIPAPNKHLPRSVLAPEIPERARLIPDSLLLIPDPLQEQKPAPPTAAPLTPAKPEKRSRRKPETFPLPDGFAISERVAAWAAAKGHHSLQTHFDSFVSKAKAKGYVYADWDEAFMEAVRANWANVGAVPNSRAGPAQPLGKTAQAINQLQAMKHELAKDRTTDRIPETPLLGFGPDSR